MNTICPDCGAMVDREDAIEGRCPQPCARELRAERNRIRNGRPWRWIWESLRWRCQTRPAVLLRDKLTCQDCGRTELALGENERLLVDHKNDGGLRAVLCAIGLTRPCSCSSCARAFDVDELQTLCSTCSGRKDGSRAGQPIPAESGART